MPKEMKMFKCNHCKRKYTSHRLAEKHENQCYYNEDCKSCVTCIYPSVKQFENGDMQSWCYERNRQIYVSQDGILDCPYWSSMEDMVYGIEE